MGVQTQGNTCGAFSYWAPLIILQTVLICRGESDVADVSVIPVLHDAVPTSQRYLYAYSKSA